LLGRPFASAPVEDARDHYLYNIVHDEERNGYGIFRDTNTTFTPEEIVGMILERGIKQAETSRGTTIKDVVLVVCLLTNSAPF
jgi:molecular chaperone DnaK (HSP70)